MVGRRITPLWRHRQREQFARAVDAQPDAAPAVDEAFADELAVVELLRRAAETSGPDAAAKARMRERVLNAAPSSSAEVRRRRPRGGARGRLVIALAAALCLVFSLTGTSLLLSRDALPGDALYGVKRTAESASLGLTFGEDSKGHKRLEFASARLAEMETLVDRYRDSGGGPLGGYLTALTDFDADAAAGSRVLATVGSNSDQRTLDELREWATSQAGRLTDLRSVLPAEAADRAGASLDLLDRIAARAQALRARTDCASVTTGQFDQVGPIPDEGECVAPPVTSTPSTTGQPSLAAPTPADAPTTSGGGVLTGSAPASPGGTSAATPPAHTTLGSAPPLPLPTLTLPSLPLPSLGG